jgi:aryl-alcohol dehydrogenase-like predicted oxidoreductase
MRYRKLGNSGIDVSVVGFGTWAMGNDSFGEIDENLAVEALRAGVDSGINLIDTAPAYGDGYSEQVIGKAIRGIRDKVVIATKCGLYRFQGEYFRSIKPTLLKWGLERSLKNMGTDYIDLLQIHYPDMNNSFEAAYQALTDMKKEGKIRAIGVSNFSAEQIQRGIDLADISSMQPQLSLLDRRSLKEIIPFCADRQLGVLTYGSLAGGILTGRFTNPQSAEGKDLRSNTYNFYSEPNWSKCQQLLAVMKGIASAHSAAVAEVAINWSLAQRGVTSALVGASKPYQAVANAKAGDWELAGEEIEQIDDTYNKLFNS